MIPLRAMSPLVRYDRTGPCGRRHRRQPTGECPERRGARSDQRRRRARHHSTADGIVLIGAGTTFIAGADINIFKQLEEGYATRAGGIDVVYVNGFGFPRHRGGPMFYADTVGLSTVLPRVNSYRQQFGDDWRPASLLEKLFPLSLLPFPLPR